MFRRGLSANVVLATMLMGVFATLSPQASYAAGGNVQLRVVAWKTSSKLTFVEVRGWNQHDRWSVWSKSFNPAVTETTTGGWWWNGSQKIVKVTFNSGERLECAFATNNYPWTNVETVGISPNGDAVASGPGARCSKV